MAHLTSVARIAHLLDCMRAMRTRPGSTAPLSHSCYSVMGMVRLRLQRSGRSKCLKVHAVRTCSCPPYENCVDSAVGLLARAP